MNEWEAKYKALAAGITDAAMIANAERVVESAIRISTHTPQTFDEVLYALLQAIGVQQVKHAHDVLDCLGRKSSCK